MKEFLEFNASHILTSPAHSRVTWLATESWRQRCSDCCGKTPLHYSWLLNI